MATIPRSRKEKGNRLERKVAEGYRHYGIDSKATRMPMSGAMSNHKGDIWKPNDYGYVDECKNSERVQLWEWWTQAASQAQGLQIPILHISRNNSPILTVMNMETYFQLRLEILQLQEELTKLKEG